MPDNVFLNKDRTAVVDQWAAGKKFQVSRAEAVRLGLLDTATKPVQERRSSPPLLNQPEKVGPTAPQKRRYTKRK